MRNPCILIKANEYFSKLLDYHGITYNPFLQKNFLSIVGFDEYNFLYTINSIFSTSPLLPSLTFVLLEFLPLPFEDLFNSFCSSLVKLPLIFYGAAV